MITEIYINSSTSFEEQLVEIEGIEDKINLHIQHGLSNEDLLALEKLLLNDQITLTSFFWATDANLISNPIFLRIIKALNKQTQCTLDLSIPDNGVEAFHSVLIKQVAPIASYPIHLFNTNAQDELIRIKIEAFQKKIINNIQKKHQQAISEKHEETSSPTPRRHRPVNSQGKKIKLKQLLSAQTHEHAEITQYIGLEVQHVETVQEVIEDVVEEQVVHEAFIQNYNGELITYEHFNSDLYKKVAMQNTGNTSLVNHLYQVLNKELFANLPHAIKYLTPEAADELAVNLPELVSMNKDNLPEGFLLKQTTLGEYVLDYDPYEEPIPTNVFTPIIPSANDNFQAIYDVKFTQQQVQKWIADSELYTQLSKSSGFPEHISNLWIKYGDNGVETFFNDLKALRNHDSDFDIVSHIVSDYLLHIPQWDHFYKNEAFFNTLKRVAQYDTSKQTCLFKFLENTGCSRHDIVKTVSAFEVFWNEVSTLCIENNVAIDKINSDWVTPTAGNPVVYMERMLCIIRNARNIEDQFEGFKSFTWHSDYGDFTAHYEFQLSNYGAYYASQYEDFKSVSSRMNFDYNPNNQNKQAFSRDYNLYRLDLDQLTEYNKYTEEEFMFSHFSYRSRLYLINDSEIDVGQSGMKELIDKDLVIPFSKKKFVPPYKVYLASFTSQDNDEDYDEDDEDINRLTSKEICNKIQNGTLEEPELVLISESKPKELPIDNCGYRFIGQQSSGITVSALENQVDTYRKNHSFTDLQLLISLFFVSHERYKGNQPLAYLFRSLERSSIHREVVMTTLAKLRKLYKLDIRLNDEEGLLLFQQVAGMNSFEFEQLGLQKEEVISKLIDQLQHNKVACFKYLALRAAYSNPKWPMTYALDTAEVLSGDATVAHYYRDDLLSLGHLLNTDIENSYHHHIVEAVAPKWRKPSARDAEAEALGNKIRAERAEKLQLLVLKVQEYLRTAAVAKGANNLQQAITMMLHATQPIGYHKFIKVCEEVSKLNKYNLEQVKQIIQQNTIRYGTALPEVFTKDLAFLKNEMIDLVILLRHSTHQLDQDAEDSLRAELAQMTVENIQVVLDGDWSEGGVALAALKWPLKKLLHNIKEISIKTMFEEIPRAKELSVLVGSKLQNLASFRKCNDFARVNQTVSDAQQLANLFGIITNNPYVQANEQEFKSIFSEVDFAVMDHESLFAAFSLLAAMPQRNYLDLVSTLFRYTSSDLFKKENFILALDYLTLLNNNYVPSDYLESLAQIVIRNIDEQDIAGFVNHCITLYNRDNRDPVLKFLLHLPDLSFSIVTKVLNCSMGLDHNRDKVTVLLAELSKNQQISEFFTVLSAVSSQRTQDKILEIIALSHAMSRPNDTSSEQFTYVEFISLLDNLEENDLEQLHEFYQRTPLSKEALVNALKNKNSGQSFEDFLLILEKCPFGARHQSQFDCSEVERVINNSQDLVNATSYTYHYRKKLMEAFLFVNAIGNDLPIFNNKTAKDLSNQELQEWFNNCIEVQDSISRDPFANRLLAIAIMREAMYRSTGEFPFSTQIIALIDGMMHEGDFISNIDTGQGKSLIDTMKAALLYLDSDRVDITTSSLVDAKRDIENYGSFLRLLGIPYSEQPISSNTDVDNFKTIGINHSTFSQLSLFFSKAKAYGYVLESSDTRVSLVINESDHALLDDKVIYRFAATDGVGIKSGQEWIYEGINEFVTNPEFLINHNTSAQDDVYDLKAYLKAKARNLGKSFKVIDRFDDDAYITWLESALIVNFKLKENVDYVIPDVFEKKIINGVEYRSKVAKILMKDGKLSPDSTFGNGMQQLLYAKLNKEAGSADFIIEPETRTIISTNNKNLLQYYRAKKGFIWGSSGTVGSALEIDEQAAKYGFEFAKNEPHQEKRVQVYAPEFFEDEQQVFDALQEKLSNQNISDEQRAPDVVFCKDITTATRLYQQMQGNGSCIQLYTGVGKEEEYIKQAAQAGMITITTSALGRNTDVPYNKKLGLNIWHTCIDSTRLSGQKSGRTGRQGSIGEVHFLFNKQDMQGHSIDEIRQALDTMAAQERTNNEQLYDVIGYLLTVIDRIDPALFKLDQQHFIRDTWAKLSKKIETCYKDHKRRTNYQREAFIEEVVHEFNSILQSELTQVPKQVSVADVLAATDKSVSKKERYFSSSQAVTLTDCIPPVTIAYNLLDFISEDKNPAATKSAIKEKLQETFACLTKKTSVAINIAYYRYLCEIPSTMAVVVEAHREFLSEFLRTSSVQPSVFERWFGYQSVLNKIASDEHYLLMFQSLVATPGYDADVTAYPQIQSSVISLLDEYLDNAWFVNKERRVSAAQLKQAVSHTQTLEDLVSLLVRYQTTVASADMRSQGSIPGKPLHFFGHSRYQTVLSRALNVTTALSKDASTGNLIASLSKNLDNTQAINHDLLKHTGDSFSGRKKVIAQCLDNAFTIEHRKTLQGMRGRTFFNAAEQDELEPQLNKDKYSSGKGA